MQKRIVFSGLMACFLVSSLSATSMAKGPKNKSRDVPPGQAKEAGERATGKGLIKNDNVPEQVEAAEQDHSRNRVTGPQEKATGDVGYEAAGLYRELEFNAHEQDGSCQASWQVEGQWVVSLGDNATRGITSDNGTHGMTIGSQDEDGNLAGSGGYPASMPYTQAWTLSGSYVDGENVHLEMDYNASEYYAVLDGTVDANGTMSGEWRSSSYQSGNWTTTSGAANQAILECGGKGMLYYSDQNGSWYDVAIQYVKVDGDTAWFAGPVISASDSGWMDNWFFGKVLDIGEPAAGVDQVWGSFTSMEEAEIGVATGLDPEAGPFPVDMGNLQVHVY